MDWTSEVTIFELLVMKSRAAAASGIGQLSTGEALAAALVLNRPDWLISMGYTIAEALDRIEPEWIPLIPEAAKAVAQATLVMNEAARSSNEESALVALEGQEGEVIDVRSTLVTYGCSPGYRNVSLVFDVERFKSNRKYRLALSINADDGERIAHHIIDAHRIAWDGNPPLDARPGETRPKWIG